MIQRRPILTAFAALPLAASPLRAATRQIGWEDLIPPGVPYSEIIGEGTMDEAADVWLPVFDEHAYKFVDNLNNRRIRIPGYMLPLENTRRGVTEFILVPYAGACIHVPPPPPNQLIFATATRPYRAETLFEAIWVEGPIRVNPISTNLAEIGYEMTADVIETYEWL